MPLDVKRAYDEIAKIEQPNPMQEALFRGVTSNDCAVLLKAPTGTGKTEAVTVPCLATNMETSAGLADPRRLFLILPARSLVDDQVQRLYKMLARASEHSPRPMSLVVDTGSSSARIVWKNGQKIEQANRHLYDGDVIVTTLDKFLYRFFAFGEENKSYTFPFRIHYGARRSLFCFDEAHSYDDVAFTNFVDLVRALYLKGQDVVVMTATMPSDYESELASLLNTFDFTAGADGEALRAFYTAQRTYEDKRLTYVSCKEKDIVPQLVKLARKHFTEGRRVIVTAEKVDDAVAVYDVLVQTFGDRVLLYHGRLAERVEGEPNLGRRAIYHRVKELDEQKNGFGYLLVTTSAIEVGCDLDAHTLITEICNPEQLLQRAGRCNRRGQTPDAQVIVVGEHIKSFLREMDKDDEEEYRHVLQEMDGKPLDVPKILACIRKRPQFDYRVQMTFQMLYEYVYEARRENKRLHDVGLVITRSWEPSVTLTTNQATMADAVSANISQCSAPVDKPHELSPDVQLFRRVYRDDGSHRYELEPVEKLSGCAYFFDLVVQVPKAMFDPQRGYAVLPKAFLAMTGRHAYKHWAVFPTYEERAKLIAKGRGTESVKGAWFWYLDRLPEVGGEVEEEESNADERES